MEPTIAVERDCSALGGLFQIIINDMKGGTPTWEDFLLKATKFHSQLKATIIASTAFLDAFQKIADMATSTRGGTKEVGTALTRLCLRHRSVEARLKTFTSSIMDCLILPLQDRLEEWKKITATLDKDHSKECKRIRTELKKRHLDNSNSLTGANATSLKFKKQAFKNVQMMSKSMDSMESSEKLFIFEEMEKRAVKRALIEERSRFCLFVNFLRPVVEEELQMLQEVTHLQEILDSLCKLTTDPYTLPTSSELVISDLKLSCGDATSWSLQTPPSSPSSFGSRKSSMCSISSFNSSSSGSTHSPSHHCRYRSLSQVSSLSEQSSGSTSSTSSIPPSNTLWPDANLRPHTIAFEKTRSNNQSYEFPDDSTLIGIDDSVNTSEESLCIIINNDKSKSLASSETPPQVSVGEIHDDKPTLPNKPEFSKMYTSTPAQQVRESQPIYANSAELFNDQDFSVAYSEGSITPTNPERCSSPTFETQQAKSNFNTSSMPQRPSKPPPLPPPRTSNLSNPNAITIGTLKSVGASTYEEIKNLGLNSVGPVDDGRNALQNNKEILLQQNNCNIKIINQMLPQSVSSTSNQFLLQKTTEYKSAKQTFENRFATSQGQILNSEESSTTLPAPPPEAFSDTDTSHCHYNKITNVHRQFLETLNNKLAASPPQRISPRITKRRSMSLTQTDDDWNSDSAISESRAPTHQSIQQTLFKLMTGGSKSSSPSRQRHQSPDTTRKKAAFTLASCDRETLMASLNLKLAQRQQSEVAKAAAASAMQRKQSVPDLYGDPTSLQNKYMSTSTINLYNNTQSQQIYQPAVQLQMRFQNKDICPPPPQQPIYVPVVHQQQAQKRNSQSATPSKSMPSRQTDNLSDKNLSIQNNPKPPSAGQTMQNYYQSAQNYSSEIPNCNHRLNHKQQSAANQQTTMRPDVNFAVSSQEMTSSHENFESAVAARVTSWFKSVQLPPEMMLRRETLMDQIRRGTQLKKVTSNDRSAPKIP